MKKRLLALLLAMVMMFALVSCTGGKDDEGKDYSGSGKLFEDGATIEVMVASHASWPYDENWPMWELFREKTGANIVVNAVPSEDFGTKIPIMMAGGKEELPDMIFFISGKSVADNFGPQGGFVSISENLDKMPNYKAFWEALPAGERADNMMLRMSGDGEIYFPPNYGIQTVGNTRTWMYRKDIFEKNNIKVPTTMDEAYQVAKKLKSIYPNSYPFAIRAGFSNMCLMAPQWKEHFSLEMYFDYNDNTWHYGCLEPEAKEMVEYFRKLVAEDLIPTNFLTIAATEWEEIVANDRGFMMLEYLLRIDHFNVPAREKNAEYTWAAMMPPKATATKGQHIINNQSYELAGYMVCNTGDQKGIDNSLKLLDWMYSPEGIEFQSWGKEGVTYKVNEEGKKEWNVGDYGSPYGDLGMGTPGLYQCVEFEANEALYSEEQGVAGAIASQYQAERYNPANFLAFADDLATEKGTIATEIYTYVQEEINKFVLGQKPMSEWDSFVNGIKDRNVDRLIELYTEQYNRVLNGGNIW